MKNMPLNIQLFAVSYSTTFSESNINAETNTSSLTVNIYFSANNTTTFFSAATLSCTVNGVVQSATVSHPAGGSVSRSFTFDNIAHNDDGTKTVAWNWYCATGTGGIGTLNISGNQTLSVIPRASTFTSNSGTSSTTIEFGQPVTFNITRAVSTFTHKLEYRILGTSTNYTMGTDIGTSFSYTFSTDLIASYPNSAIPQLIITLTTYSGTTTIGTDTDWVYQIIPASYVPSCSLSLVDTNSITSTWGVYVKTKSIIQGNITASGIAGSTISTYSSVVNNTPYLTNPFTFTPTTSGNVSVVSTVTDSRTRTASDTETISVLDYNVPTYNSITVKRCLVDGTLNEDGTYGKVVCNYTITSLNNNNNKSLSVTQGTTTKTFTLSSYSTEYVATDLFSGLSTTSNYTFTFKLGDSFYYDDTSISQTYTMTPSYNLVSYFNGGKGITFGQVAIAEGFNCYLDSDFKGDLKYKGNDLLDLIYPIGRGFIDHTDTDYSNYLGFTWVKTLVGMTPVGQDTTQTEFDTLGETGGAKVHTLSISQIPNVTGNIIMHNQATATNIGSASGCFSSGQDAPRYFSQGAGTAGAISYGIINFNLGGGGGSHNNLQPYQVVNFWKRTA